MHDVGLDYIAAKLHFDGEHFDTEVVKHDKLLVVVLMENPHLATKASQRCSAAHVWQSVQSANPFLRRKQNTLHGQEIVGRIAHIDLSSSTGTKSTATSA